MRVLYQFCIVAYVSIAITRAAAEDVLAPEYTLERHTIRQPVAHADPNGATFEQHYAILIPNDATRESPVFYHYGNETPATNARLIALYEAYPRDVPLIFIQGEHRGYGQSVTDDQDQSIPAYVRIDEVHADTRALLTKLKQDFAGPWIMAGYSYGGGLVIDYAARYPGDVDAVLSSSGVVDWPFMMDAYDRQVRETLGADAYARVREHMLALEPIDLFDKAWLDREFISVMVHAITQMGTLRSFQEPFREMTKLPTAEFVQQLRGIDDSVADGLAWRFAQGNGMKHLSREDKLTELWDWRVWRYQQCVETGVFESNAGDDGIFTRTEDDYCEECEALFGVYNNDQDRWSPRGRIESVTVPIVFVNGALDPWSGLGIQVDDSYSNVIYMNSPDGLHCPDREDPELGRQVMDALLKAVGVTTGEPK